LKRWPLGVVDDEPAHEAGAEARQQLTEGVVDRAGRLVEAEVLAEVRAQGVVADDVADGDAEPEVGAEAAAADVERARQQHPREERADRLIAAGPQLGRPPEVLGEARRGLVGLREVVVHRQRGEERGRVELHHPQVVAGRGVADVDHARAVVADLRVEGAADDVGDLGHCAGLEVVGVDVEDLVAVAAKQQVAAVGRPARREVEEAVGGDAAGGAAVALVDVDVAIAALAPGRVRDPAAVGGDAGVGDLLHALDRRDLGDRAGVQVEEGQARLGDVVAHEGDAAAVGGDVRIAGAHADGQGLDLGGVLPRAEHPGLAGVPQVQLGPAVAHVVHDRLVEDHVARAGHEVGRGGGLDLEHGLDVEGHALAADADALADAAAAGGDPAHAGVGVAVVAVVINVLVVGRTRAGGG
jgi:hypothetical protein